MPPFKILIGVIIIILLCFIGTMAMVNSAYGHDNHLNDRGVLGPDVLYMVECEDASWLVMVDTDKDKVVDTCWLVKTIHDTVHYKLNRECACEEEEWK